MSKPICGKCGLPMTPADSRIHPEYFLHDACLPDELKPPAPIGGAAICGMTAERDRQAFLDACTDGEPDSRSQWQIGWLDALLSDLITSDWPRTHEDPLACWEAIRECQELAQELREACEKAVPLPAPVCQQSAEDDTSEAFPF